MQALILEGQNEFAMFEDLLDYGWVLPLYRYQSEKILLANLDKEVSVFPKYTTTSMS